MDKINIQELRNEAEMGELASYCYTYICSLHSKAPEQSSAIHLLLDRIHQTVVTPVTHPITKILALLILREFTNRADRAVSREEKFLKMFRTLASHRLFKYCVDLAVGIDPESSIQEKGTHLFQNFKQIGQQFMRLILEIILYFSLKFPYSRNKEPTAYKIYHEELIRARVVFPDGFYFFKLPKREEISDTSTIVPGKSMMKASLRSDIDGMNIKISHYMEEIEEQRPKEEQLQLITTAHSLFEIELKKYQQMEEKGLFRSQNQVVQSHFEKIIDFLSKETVCFEKWVRRQKDCFGYCGGIKSINKEAEYRSMGKIPSKIQRSSEDRSKPPSSSNSISRGGVKSSDSLSPPGKHFKQPDEKSLSPSFKLSYRTRLEQNFKDSENGSRGLLSPRVSNMGSQATSVRTSKVDRIFLEPPNKTPKRALYAGKIVGQCESLRKELHSITKVQGVRRFKSANFRNKGTLFLNDEVEIGFKTSLVDNHPENYQFMIRVMLYITNVGRDQIDALVFTFSKSKDMLLFSNPKNIETVLAGKGQHKQQLIIVPLSLPYHLVELTVSYIVKEEMHKYRLMLPNSMLKLASYRKVPWKHIEERWKRMCMFRTKEFRLCRYIPPKSFQKWLPELINLTSYTDFAALGSETDFQLFCEVALLKKYDGILKISIRPNLFVVVQLGIDSLNAKAEEFITYYLQTIQQFLQEID